MIDELHLENLNGRKVLIVWSGGLDSTSLLWRVMTETTAWVFTHFVDLVYGEPNAEAAARAAVAAQRIWLREHVRDWQHSESFADVTGIHPQSFSDALRRKGSPSLLYHYTTHGAGAAVFHGFEAGDFVLSGRNSDADAPVRSERERLLARFKENAIAGAYQFRPAPIFAALTPPPTREEARAALPEDLAALLISCPNPVADPDSPVGWRDCGICSDCDPESAAERARPAAIGVLDLAARFQAQAEQIRGGPSSDPAHRAMRLDVRAGELSLDGLNGRRVLVPWSGGVDSTSLLYRLLTETTADVHTHFVRLGEGAPEATPAAEAAIKAQRAWLQEHVRDWPHTESSPDGTRLEFPDEVLPHRHARALIYLEEAASAAVEHGLEPGDYVLTGRSRDRDAPIGSVIDRVVARFKLNAIGHAYGFGPAPSFTVLNPLPSRAEALAALPEPLRGLTTSCPKPVADPNSPIGWRDCGTCPDCTRGGAVVRGTSPAGRQAGLASELQEQAEQLRGHGKTEEVPTHD